MATDQVDWHLDRRITILLIFVIIGHALSFGWYASKQDSRMEIVEKNDNRQTTLLDKLVEDQAVRNERTSALEGELRAMKELLVKVDGKVDRLVEHRFGDAGIRQQP
jgi:hypothetical protein